MNKQAKELKEKGYISGVEVGHLICQRNCFSGANKEFYSIFKQLRKLKSTIVIDGEGDTRGRKYYFLKRDVIIALIAIAQGKGR